MDKDNWYWKIIIIKELLIITLNKVKAYWKIIFSNQYMKGNSKMIKWMDMVFINGKMGPFFKENFIIIEQLIKEKYTL